MTASLQHFKLSLFDRLGCTNGATYDPWFHIKLSTELPDSQPETLLNFVSNLLSAKTCSYISV